MPDPKGDSKADEATIPDTPLHAYKEGREEDIEGDADKLSSNDPKDLRASEIEDPDEGPGAPPKH